jgi:hypothetical protein
MGSAVKGDHINSVKLSGNIMKLYIQRIQYISVFRVHRRTNSSYFPILRSLGGFCNRDGVC